MILNFEGLSRPVALVGCDHLLDRFAPLLNGWPVTVRPSSPGAAAASSPPTITVRRSEDGYTIASEWTDGIEAYRDDTDIVCALFADLIMAHAAEDKALVHLHAGAVQWGGRLLVFPSGSKGGKSTLSAQLARIGGRVFSDDVLPVRSRDGRAVALGMAPRLRLPLAKGASEAFRAFVAARNALANDKYAYLALDGRDDTGILAPRGEQAAIGSFILLQRDASNSPALEVGSRSALLRLLVRQHFETSLSSVEVLNFLHGLVSTVPCLNLRYREAEDAVAMLQQHVREYTDRGESLRPAPAAMGSGR